MVLFSIMFCISCVIHYVMHNYASLLIINVHFFSFLPVPSTTVQKVFLNMHYNLFIANKICILKFYIYVFHAIFLLL